MSYGGQKLFEDVSFNINYKERCGLVGRNGSGKTTLFRLLTGKEAAESGSIHLSRGYKLGYLDQHIHFSAKSVLDEACLGLKEEDKDKVYLAEKLLFGLGFKKEDLHIDPKKLSGGYHLRLHLIKVLLSEPNCLLLDEPTNYLDILSLRFLSRFLQRWNNELVLISHDREFMDSITTHTLGIHRQKVDKVKGSSIDFYNKLLLEEEVHERNRQNIEKKRAHLQAYIDRFGAKASKASQAASKKKALGRIPSLEELKSIENLDFHFKQSPFLGKKMVEVKEISFSYDNAPLIENFSLEVESKDKIAIIGKNGHGKSTLLKLLAGELKPSKGEIKLFNNVNIGYFGQTNISRLNDQLTVEEEIKSANENLSYSDLKTICAQMLFKKDNMHKKIAVLSGGEKSRVLLGKILAKPTNLLLLDEPTQHLDIESVEALIDALEDFKGSYIIVTHSELILKRLSVKKIVLCSFKKQDLFLGTYEDFLEKVGFMEEEDKKKKVKEEPLLDKNPPVKKQKSLEKEIQVLEKKIISLEESVEKQYFLLTEASLKNEKETIQSLSVSIKEKEEEIKKLYDDYTKLTDELEK